ncbi:hypothetical protein HBA54_00450 [Pelagibius litoralis]|uniref:SPOR domain-containing protein n=1 Tax=Pelagibius litoralis TaxID=374515 RepID=A0A967EUE6_9PROT|nr:SPOR domain-containing protein [Pelagibius litoralis]NIA67056.1 hypothetical protein [Pelagibius litoralis]
MEKTGRLRDRPGRDAYVQAMEFALMLTRFHRAVGPLLLVAATLGLSGCQAMYDDTKGWANRLEASVMKAAEDLAKGTDQQHGGQSGLAWAEENRGEFDTTASGPGTVQEAATTMVMSSGTPGPAPVETAQPDMSQTEQPETQQPASDQTPAQPQTAGPIDPTGPGKTKAANSVPLPRMKPTLTVAEKPKATEKDSKAKAAEAKRMVIHLSSLRSERAAKKEWEALKRAFPEQLSEMLPRFTPTEIAERGTFYRILAGPLPSKKAARQVCKALKAKKQYCQVMSEPPSA